MMHRNSYWFSARAIACAALGFALLSPLGLTGQTQETGSIRGRVSDTRGLPLPGAVIRVKGPQGSKGAETDEKGNYSLPYLPPGVYEVTVTMDGYSTQVMPGVQVAALQTSVMPFKLAEGADVVVVTAGHQIDTTSSTSMTKVDLSAAVSQFAQDRSFTAVFDFAPGAIANSGVGGGNYSIGGASGLENQYLISGINITGSGYGSIGTYDAFGAYGSGMTTAFLDTLDIREGGFEAEYGGALGGVISATVKHGSNDFHGDVDLMLKRRSWEGERRKIGRFNFMGRDVTDLSFSMGGPIVRDRLFFFAGYNPYWFKNFFLNQYTDRELALDGAIAPYANQTYSLGANRSDNFAARVSWVLTPNHRLEFLWLGSPQRREGTIGFLDDRVAVNSNPGMSGLGLPDVGAAEGVQGTRRINDNSYSIQYYGSLRPQWQFEFALSRHTNTLKIVPGAGASNTLYYDNRRADINDYFLTVDPSLALVTSGLGYSMGGYGSHQRDLFDQNTVYSLKNTIQFNALGSHELKFGAEFGRYEYRSDLVSTGIKPEVFLSANSAYKDSSYAVVRSGTIVVVSCGSRTTAGTDLLSTCTGTPRYRMTGGELNPQPDTTLNEEWNFFVQDTWTVKNVSMKLGLRYNRQELSNPQTYTLLSTRNGAPLVSANGQVVGSNGTGTFYGSSYKFKGEIAPRLGISWDIMGNGKSRLYANFGRLYERIPNDLADRSFGNEVSVFSTYFANPDLTGQSNPPQVVGVSPTRVVPGTRLPYKDDLILGYEFELAPGFKIDIKGNFRKQGRTLEDTQSASVESILNAYYSYLLPYCTNCQDLNGSYYLFPQYGVSFFREYVLSNPGENSEKTYPDINNCTGATEDTCLQIPTNFIRPENRYKALSITLQKQPREGGHLSLHATYRLSRLTGNYEGLFRNDNGQSDPNITSLYDFANSPLTASQFYNGVLNTDTPHALRIHVGWKDLFVKNLNAALSYKWNSGQPRTPLLSHPIYGNSGEIPGINPTYFNFDFDGDVTTTEFQLIRGFTPVHRGYSGRTPDIHTWDLKFGYSWQLGKSTLTADVLAENILNNTTYTDFNDNADNATFYGQPTDAHEPRQIRLGLHWSF